MKTVIAKLILAVLALFLTLVGISKASEILLEMEVNWLEYWILTMPWVIVPSIGILIISLGNQRGKISVVRLLIFYGCFFGSMGIGWFISSLFTVAAGVFAGGLTGGLTGAFVGYSAGTDEDYSEGIATSIGGGCAGITVGAFAGMFAGMYAGFTPNYQIIQDYMIFIAIVCLDSFLISRILPD